MIRVHEPLKLAQDLPLVVTIVGNQAAEEIIVDLAIDVVDIGLLHPLSNVILVSTQGIDAAGMFRLHDRHVLLECLPEPLIHLRRQRNLGDKIRELLQQPLLPHIRFRATLLEVAAAIVDVLLLLDVSNERAPAVSAPYQAGEKEILVVGASPRLVPTFEHRLHLLIEVDGYEGLM